MIFQHKKLKEIQFGPPPEPLCPQSGEVLVPLAPKNLRRKRLWYGYHAAANKGKSQFLTPFVHYFGKVLVPLAP